MLAITFPSEHQCKPESGSAIIITSFFLYQIFDFGYSSNVKYIRKSDEFVPFAVYKFLIVLIVLISPLVLYKLFLRLRYVQQVGYINYTLNKDDLELPVYLKGVGWLFNVVFWALIISAQPNRKIGFFWILYLLVSLVDSMKGNRAAFAINLVMCFYFMTTRRKINPKKLFFIMVISFGLFMLFYLLVTNMREASGTGHILYKSDKSLFQKIIVGIFYNQTVSLNIPLLYFDNYKYMSENHFFCFLFSDLLNYNYKIPLLAQGELLRKVLYTPKGYGLGFCFLLELYDLGILSLPIAFMIGKFMKFVDKNFWRNPYKIGYFALCFMSIIYMPRHIIFDFLAPIRLSWIVFSLLIVYFASLYCKYGRYLYDERKLMRTVL